MSFQRYIPGVPWKRWAREAWPKGWLAIGGPREGELLEAGKQRLEVMEPSDALMARWWSLTARIEPEAVAFTRHVYRHEKVAFPPDLMMHVYVHESLTQEQGQRVLFRILLMNRPGVEDVFVPDWQRSHR